MHALLQCFRHEFTTSAACLAGVAGVNQHHLSTGAFSLIDRELLELAPGRIQNTFIKGRVKPLPSGMGI
jgi:hypothetical protein